MKTSKELLATIEDFINVNNMSASTFGRLAINNPSLVFNLRKGCQVLETTQNRILAFINNYTEQK